MDTPPAAPPDPQPRRTLRASTVEDLLAAVPVVLGFEPRESVVMLTSGAPQAFHARTDLPPPAGSRPGEREAALTGLAGVADVLLAPVLRHGVPTVVLLVLSGDARLARDAGRVLLRRFRRAGVRVTVCAHADGSRWWDLAADVRGPGQPYAVATHPFRLQAVVDGQVTHASREALAASLRPDPAGAARVAGLLGRVPALDRSTLAACCAGRALAGSLFDDAELAAVARALADPGLAEGAWTALGRDHALAQVRLWTDAVRRTPSSLRTGVAAVLGLAAWLAGQGALAWCAVDLARPEDAHPLVDVVAALLEDAEPPSSWPVSGPGPGGARVPGSRAG